MLVSLIVFSLIALLSDYISKYLKNHTHAGFYLKWLQIIVFVGIGLFILLSEK